MSFVHANDAAMGVSNYERKPSDFYPTPSWCSEAVIPYLLRHGVTRDTHIWEPACGDGAMATVLGEVFTKVTASDLHDYGFGRPRIDFLAQDVNWKGSICTNPPYGDLAEAFIRHALKVTEKHGGVVAMLLRNEYDCAKGRADLFRIKPFARKVVLTTRPRWIADSTGAPRHSYAWFIWSWRHSGEPVISHDLKGK